MKSIFRFALIAIALALPAFAQSDAVALARQLAAEVLAEEAQHAGHAEGVMALPLPIDTPSVRPQVAAFNAEQVQELERVLASKETDPGTAASVAFALFVAEPQRAEQAVEHLLVQMDRMMFFDPHVAHQLIVEIGKPAIPTLVEHLDEGMALGIVESLGPEARSAVPALLERLGPQNVDVAAALAAIGTPEAIAKAKPVLINALQDLSNPLAKLAVQTLGELGTRAKEAIPAVRRALSATDPDTRMYAAIALADMGDTTNSVKALGELIAADVVGNEFAAFEKLRALGSKARPAREALLTTLRATARGEERLEAAATLLAVDPKHPTVVKTLKELSNDPVFGIMLAGRPDLALELENLN